MCELGHELHEGWKERVEEGSGIDCDQERIRTGS